ncbi:MAG: Panacea domain-containing protein [Ignavibacteriaceae bacterium]|jgi:uncharacterized phage-associated protein
MLSENGFSYKKATQSLAFFAQKEIDNTLDKLKALKLIYFADRYHLRKFGRTISNDEYYAMDYGPVASGTKDILEMSTFLDIHENDYASKFLEPQKANKNIKAINQVDYSELSVSEIEALNFVWDKLGSKDNFYLVNLTHQYPEWKKHEEQLKRGITRIKMDLTDFFDDSTSNVEKFYELNAEEKEAKIEFLKELNHLESLWN